MSLFFDYEIKWYLLFTLLCVFRLFRFLILSFTCLGGGVFCVYFLPFEQVNLNQVESRSKLNALMRIESMDVKLRIYGYFPQIYG